MRSATWAVRRASAWRCWSIAVIARFPIQPDVVGLNVATDCDDHVRVRLHPVDPVEEVVKIAAGRRSESPPRGVPSRDQRIVSAPCGRDTAPWSRKHLLGLEDLSREEILAILDTAESFAEISTRSRKKVPALQGRIVFNLFFENSTRTRTSFSLAAKRLSADTQDFSAERLEPVEGRVVHRHGQEHRGDGGRRRGGPPSRRRARPTCWRSTSSARSSTPATAPTSTRPRGCSDLMTIRRAKGRIDGLTVGLLGDISHSRVARSNIWGLTKLGAKVILCGPPTLVPRGWERLGCEVAYHLDEVLPRCDVVNVLRIQFERQQGGLFPSVAEYSQFYMMTQERLQPGQGRPARCWRPARSIAASS